MNIKNIQPISIWIGGEKTATILSLYDFTDYHFDGGEGKVHYKLIGMENGAAVEYYNGSVSIPADIIGQWGDDDTIIWDYVTQTLGIVLT